MITDAGKVFYTAPADKNNRVFLKVMANTWDIGGYFSTVR
jgi:hypothetical protein